MTDQSAEDTSLRQQLETNQRRISQLQADVDERDKDINDLRAKIMEITGQVEELSVSPLDLIQQQRARALTMARDVVKETSGAGMFSKSGAKVSLAGVVSTAHFIISGDRDYVVTEGEFIERQHDGRRRGEVLPPEAQARPVYTDAGYAETGSPAPHSDLDQPEVDDDQ